MTSAPPAQHTLVRKLSAGGGAAQPFLKDECYVEIYLESCRLENGRRFATRFHSVVYCFVRLARDGEADAELAAMTKPEKLANLDPDNLDRVITISKKLIGPTPWRGGALGLELGLCSVKQSNLMSGVLDLVGKIADHAGVSFIGAAKPFLPLIEEGMDLIAGQPNDTAIEVALDTDLPLQADEIIAIVASDQIDKTKLTVDPDTRELLASGRPVEASYCVFSIRPVAEKADFGTIPELKTSYDTFRKHVMEGNQAQAETAMTAFRRIALVSADLIDADRKRLADRVSGVFQSAFKVGAGAVTSRTEASVPASLSDVGLYPSK